MITTAKRLNTIEEYYFSSKLREVQLAAEGKPIINMGIGSPDLLPSQAVIDAIVDAMMKTHISTRVIRDCQSCGGYG
jgi:aspartate/methionine/tyrosine aminotransferase